MVVSNIHHHSNYTVVTEATTSKPVHGSPLEGAGADEIIPSYGVYIACIEFTLVTPIIFGNVLIIVSVFKFRRLRTYVNAFIVSLAVADLIVGVTAAPLDALFFLIAELHTMHKLCLLRYAFQVIGLGGSILNLTLISVDRFLAVYFPLTYHNKLNRTVAGAAVTAAWLIVVAMILPPLVGYHKFDPTKQCDVANIYHDSYVVFIITISICLWILDSVLYCFVVRTAWKQMKRVHKISSIANCDSNANTSSSTNNNKLRRRRQREIKKARMMAIVLGLFIIGYTPYAILSSLNHASGGDFNLARDVSVAIAMCNSCINSVIYGIMNLEFRCAYYQLLRCRKNRLLEVNSYLDSPSIVSGSTPVVHCYKQSVYSIRCTVKEGDTAREVQSSSCQEPVTMPTVG